MIHFFYKVWIFLFLFGYELSFVGIWILKIFVSISFLFFSIYNIHIFVCLDIWERKFKFWCDIGLKLWFCWVLNLRKCLLGFLYCGYEYFELWRFCVCVFRIVLLMGFFFFFSLLFITFLRHIFYEVWILILILHNFFLVIDCSFYVGIWILKVFVSISFILFFSQFIKFSYTHFCVFGYLGEEI